MLLRFLDHSGQTSKNLQADEYDLNMEVRPVWEDAADCWIRGEGDILVLENPPACFYWETGDEKELLQHRRVMGRKILVGVKTIYFQTNLYIMNDRGDTIDKVEGLRPGSRWKRKQMIEVQTGRPLTEWVEILDECDQCHIQGSAEDVWGAGGMGRLCGTCLEKVKAQNAVGGTIRKYRDIRLEDGKTIRIWTTKNPVDQDSDGSLCDRCDPGKSSLSSLMELGDEALTRRELMGEFQDIKLGSGKTERVMGKKVRDSSKKVDRVVDSGPACKKLDPKVVGEGLGAEPSLPPRMWVKIKGTGRGMAIDTDPTGSYADNVRMVLGAASQTLENHGVWVFNELPAGCPVVGEIEGHDIRCWQFEVDHREVEWLQPTITGLEIKKLVGVAPWERYQVWRAGKPEDVEVQDDERVELDSCHEFYTGLRHVTGG
jgi:hypothetical protein